MNNDITINVQELLNVPDKSITDYETIRQIGLLSCTINDVSEEDAHTLYRKVNPLCVYCGLYPSVMKTFDIQPDPIKK